MKKVLKVLGVLTLVSTVVAVAACIHGYVISKR